MLVNPLPPTLDIPAEVFTSNLARHFEALATQLDSLPAASDNSRTLTFAQVNALANQLAHTLIAGGLRLGEPVALLLHHNVTNVIAILGVIKAGGAYSALLPSDPRSLQETILTDLNCRFLVAEAGTAAAAGTLCGSACRLLVLDELADSSGDNPCRSIPSDTLASIYYTSGTTGRPKGGMRDHQSYLYRGWLEQALFPRGPEDRTTVLNPFRFAAFTGSLFTDLFNGASLHFFSLQEDGLHTLADWLLTKRITMLNISSAALSAWLDILAANTCFADLRSVRPHQRLPRQTLEKLWPHLPERSVVLHRLASTETGVVTFNCLTRETPVETDVVPVGWPVPTIEVSICNEDGTPVSQGAIGEVTIRSRFLIRGYWNRPEETRRRFSIDPDDPRYQIYHSGDLGRLRADGQLELRGRNDLMIKIRGYRVEPGEVEHALLQHPAIEEVVVIGIPNGPDETLLVAYLVTRLGIEPDSQSLRTFLLEQLPDHMIPSRFVLINKLPVTASGKVDRKRLPSIATARDRSQESNPPRTPLEHKLAAIWSEALSIKPIDIHDNFFDLGGHSLLAAQIMAKIDSELGVAISLQTFFDTPTIELLPKYLSDAQSSADEPSSEAGADLGAKLRMLNIG